MWFEIGSSRAQEAMHHFLERFVSLAPNLVTLRIAFQVDKYMLHDAEMSRHNLPASERTSDFLPVLQDTIAGMGRVQRGEGFLIGHKETWIAAEYKYALGTLWGTEVNPDSNKYLSIHEISNIGVWTYAKTPDVKRLMSASEVVGRWPVNEYPADLLEHIGPENAQVLKNRSRQLTEWIETQDPPATDVSRFGLLRKT
ncbi:hypothetical protein CC86DRAFT_430388 [Ophiobolus disseminans]|uniref:Uncharacterized protein n=1 Tax=Ophiobolus disseminans TaxID=1469910 RepID=A0A6A6ZEQ8_9PLEO|nr:hypothetical protein CC86DRAFT_430388 [Ophiobolus disseminans]